MADLHHLPAPALPEGWAQTGIGAWERGPCSVGFFAEGMLFCAFVEGRRVGEYPTRASAIAAVERAWCNCGIKEVKRG